MRRTVTSRLGAAAVAAVFVVTSGITAMEAHQLAAHASQSAETALALAPVAPPGHGAEHAHHGPRHGSADRARATDGHSHHDGNGRHDAAPGTSAASEDAARPGESAGSSHFGHSQHGPLDGCRCVGPCASGAPPKLGNATFAEIWLGETAPFGAAPTRTRVIPQDPRSYLLPFPNPPPVRA